MQKASWTFIRLPARPMHDEAHFLWSGREVLAFVLLTTQGWQTTVLRKDGQQDTLGFPETRDDAEDLVVIHCEREGYEIENRIEDLEESAADQLDKEDG